MKAISFGEVLWDIIKGKEYLGGAPFNLAAHLAKLRCESFMVSRVGNDKRGWSVLKEMSKLKVDSSFIQSDKIHPTGTVDVTLRNGQPSFIINKNAAWDFIETQQVLVRRIKSGSFDVFCFGLLAQRSETSKKTLYRILKTIDSKHIFFDVNLRQNFYSKEIVEKSFSYCDIAKLNDTEVKTLSPVLFGENLKEKDFADEVCRSFPVKIVCVTKGKDGCTVYYKRKSRNIPGIKVKVADAVGSGDAFSAGFLFKYCTGEDPFRSAMFANRIGAFVASRRGAIPEYDTKILNLTER
jgi:fructokinase